MRIGVVAKQTGITIDTIRFYEKKNLLNHAHVHRSENGYREYTDAAIERLDMIKHAQTAGFTLTEIGELFGLWEQDQLSTDLIVARLVEKQRSIVGKIAELEYIQQYITNKLQQYTRNTLNPAQSGLVESRTK
jgi:DNA-binding transcriptional MerR regulator